MFAKLLFITLVICSILIVSCTDKDNPLSISDDDIAPSSVIDMTVVNTSGNAVTIFLTATGDDGMIGRAKQYDLRYSTQIIDAANYNLATRFTITEKPNVGGVLDTIVVTGLLPLTTYYFAIKLGDEVPNWSDISNIDSATTLVGGTWSVFTNDNSDLLSDTVLDITFDGGVKYIATANGVQRFDNSSWTALYESQSFVADSTLDSILVNGLYDYFYNHDTTFYSSPNYASSLTVDDNGDLWMGLQNDRILHYDGAALTTVEISSGVRDIVATPNEIWAATSNSGLFRITDDTTWTQFTRSNSGLEFNALNALAFNPLSDLWIGYNFGGASLYNGSNFTLYNSSNGLNTTGVWALEIDGNGDIYFGTEDGLFIYDGITWTNYNTTNSGLMDDVVISLAVAPDGTIWIGTRFGLNRFDGIDWSEYTTTNSELPGNYINALQVDMFSNLWIATNDGLVAVFEE